MQLVKVNNNKDKVKHSLCCVCGRMASVHIASNNRSGEPIKGFVKCESARGGEGDEGVRCIRRVVRTQSGVNDAFRCGRRC